MDEPSTLDSSRDSKNSISATRSATDMAKTANQYRTFANTRIGVQA